MDLNCLSPYIRVAMDSIIYQPWTLRERVIFDYELLYIKEGQVKITIEDMVYDGHRGDIFLFKPKQRHSIAIVGSTRFRQPHIHFDLVYRHDSREVGVSFKPLEEMSAAEMMLIREDIIKGTEMELPNKICLRNTKLFEEILFDIIKESERKLPFYEINQKGLFLRLWNTLLRENYWSSSPVPSSTMDELVRIKDYLGSKIRKKVSLEELSEQFKISKYHLLRLFKDAFSATPIQYHQMIRIERIKEMIQYTDMSLTDIAEEFGFSSINAFSRAFKNVTGVSPSFYRDGKE